MENLIACRPESYGRYADRAFEHLETLGIKHVEIAAPATSEIATTQERLRQYGLQASSVTLRSRAQDPDFLENVAQVADAAAALHAQVIFTSQKAGDTDHGAIYDSLRKAGDVVAERQVTLALETHPDLCQNGTQALETMQAINHPAVRVNFDPANIYYYNRHVNAIQELRKIAGYVRAVHLKDTNGGFETHHFPAIGDGVVDWQTLFAIMNEQGMCGPFTFEMEGIAGEQLSYEETCDRMKRSVDYLRNAGLISF